MEEKYTAIDKGNKWSVKDIILAVIFSVLAIVILMVVNFATMFNSTINLVFAMGVIFFLISPLYIFAANKINKRFVMTIFFAIYLIYTFFTTWYNGLAIVLALIIIEVFMWKKDSYKTLWKSIIAYTVMGAATVSLSFTTFIFWDSYKTMALQSGMAEGYLEVFQATYTNPGIIAGIYAFTVICCIAGCLLSNLMFKKYFKKTGIL